MSKKPKLNKGKCTRPTNAYEGYWCEGKIVKRIPAGYRVSAEAYVDNELVGVCYKPKSPLFYIVILVIVAVIATAGVLVYKFAMKEDGIPDNQKVDTGDVSIEENGLFNTKAVIFKYNKFPAVISDSLDLRLVNGDTAAEVIVTAPGITVDTLQMEPNEERYYVPVKVDSKDELIEGKLIYKAGDSSKEFDIVIENINESYEIDESTSFEDEEVIE